MKLGQAGVLAALLLAACGDTNAIDVDDAWVRLPAVAGRPGAAYFQLHAGRQAATLAAAATPIAARAELHESMAGGHGAMAMRPLANVAVPAGGSVAFAPAGKHVMLFDLDPNAKPGDKTTLTLTFADGQAITTEAKLVGAGDAAPTDDR